MVWPAIWEGLAIALAASGTAILLRSLDGKRFSLAGGTTPTATRYLWSGVCAATGFAGSAFGVYQDSNRLVTALVVSFGLIYLVTAVPILIHNSRIRRPVR